MFPDKEPELKKYIVALQKHLQGFNPDRIINSLKTNKEKRSLFHSYFGAGRHWFLSAVVRCPETIFKLVADNKHKILEPFLKHYKKELASLHDLKGRNLLEVAEQSKKPSANLILRLKAMIGKG